MTTIIEQCPFSNPSQLFQDLSSLRDQEKHSYSSVLGGYVVSRYNDIVHVLDNPEVFSSRVTVPDIPEFVLEKFAGRVPTRGTLLGWDNPDHDRLRRSVNSFFVPRRLQRFEPDIRALGQDIIDGFVAQGCADLKDSFALPLPLKVVSLVAGLDPAKWRWVGKSLALFGGHAAMASGTFDEKVQGIIDLHEYIAELIQLRKTDRRDDLISHIWNERDAGTVTMTDFEHLTMIPGLLLAGHETTTNLLSMGITHLLEQGLWDEASKDDASRAATIEELLRYESAITGMKREVTQQTQLGSTVFQPGDVLFLAYNSGSRDPTLFQCPERIMLDRKPKTQHLGFGRGIHACLGAPLARILLKIEFELIHERLHNLRLADGFQKQYDRVHEGRGIEALLLTWDAQPVPGPKTNQVVVSKTLRKSQPGLLRQTFSLIVSAAQLIAEDILLLTLQPKDETRLPRWTPGAHIDLPVSKYGSRQYSLCSDPNNKKEWQVAVLREEKGTGGSLYVHSDISVGAQMLLRQPRNHFPLHESAKYLFIAGGIGITPIRAMIAEVRRRGGVYQLLYLGSTRSRMAFVDEFASDTNATIWPKDELGECNIDSVMRDSGVLEAEDGQSHRIYACGPERMMTALELTCAQLAPGILNTERFENHNLFAISKNKAFDVELKQSGRVLHVPAHRSVLEILNEHGCNVMSTCTKGTCGTCEVSVVAGKLEHRDTVLTEEEKRSGMSMMACVSRCADSRLILDMW